MEFVVFASIAYLTYQAAAIINAFILSFNLVELSFKNFDQILELLLLVVLSL